MLLSNRVHAAQVNTDTIFDCHPLILHVVCADVWTLSSAYFARLSMIWGTTAQVM